MTKEASGPSEESLRVERFLRSVNENADKAGADYPLSMLAFAADRPQRDEHETSDTHALTVIRHESEEPLVHTIATAIIESPYTAYILEQARTRARRMAKKKNKER